MPIFGVFQFVALVISASLKHIVDRVLYFWGILDVRIPGGKFR